MDTLQKIAVLIDADNTPASKLEAIFKKLSTYGRIVVKRAYGNWEKPTLSKWENETKRLAVKAAQQFDYTTGKNATDIAMVIDAMDLLHTGAYDAFALVSSDSDFTPLAIRLRESGAIILGAGDAKTPQSFRNACDDFILLEGLTVPEEPVVGEKVKVRRKTKEEGHSDIEAIHRLLREAAQQHQDDSGFADVSLAGSYIKTVLPDFSPKTFGFSKMSKLLEAFPQRYKLNKRKGKGKHGEIVAYKCL